MNNKSTTDRQVLVVLGIGARERRVVVKRPTNKREQALATLTAIYEYNESHARPSECSESTSSRAPAKKR